MKEERTVYICDHCNRVELALYDFAFAFSFPKMPAGWIKLGKEHLCPDCAEIYERLLSESKKQKR